MYTEQHKCSLKKRVKLKIFVPAQNDSTFPNSKHSKTTITTDGSAIHPGCTYNVILSRCLPSCFLDRSTPADPGSRHAYVCLEEV